MVFGMGDMWVRFPADGVFDSYGEEESWLWTRVDPQTNEVMEPFPFDDEGLQFVSPEALWSVGYDEKTNVRVTRFDPTTLEAVVQSEPIRSYYTSATLDPASGTVWVSAVSTIVRIDIA